MIQTQGEILSQQLERDSVVAQILRTTNDPTDVLGSTTRENLAWNPTI